MSTSDTVSDIVTSASKENRLALVVGVNNSTAPNAREMLKHSERDASGMAWALQELYCNFSVTTLRGEDAHTWGVREAILKLVGERTEKDFLLFYFSGHAQPMETSGGHRDIYLVTHNFKEKDVLADPPMHLSMRWLKNVLYERTSAGAVLIVLDCCYAGNIIHSGSDPYLIDVGKLLEDWLEEGHTGIPKDHARAILTATGHNITAQEGEGHGRMSHWLLRALRGEEKVDSSGQVDVHSLHKYLKGKIPEQRPNLEGVFGQHSWLLASHPGNIQSVLDRRYLETHQTLPFDHSLCYGASLSDLDMKQVSEFFKQGKAQKDEHFLTGLTDEALLERFEFLLQGHPTYGAILCFGQHPTSLVPGATTRCVRWDGIKRGGSLDIWDYSGSLLRQFDLSRNFLQKNLGLHRTIHPDGLKRTTETWEIPLRVLEEALANALVHREYLNRTDEVYVEVYDDRIEITSPGLLPAGLTLEQLLTEHDSKPRNTQIATIFFLAHKIEKFGTGIERMQQLMKEAGLEEPQFIIKAVEERFRVILYRPLQTNLQQQVSADDAEAPTSIGQSAITPASKPPEQVWNVPYARNSFFTGREALLEQLRERLIDSRKATLTQAQAISGLGGIGKTQIAVEYAYRHHNEYRAVLWANAVTMESLQNSFVQIASSLNLPEKDAHEQNIIVEAVKGWLAHERDWLLIFDNADDLPQISSFLPNATGTNGHIIITSRDPASGNLAEPLGVTQMEREEGTQFLLRRTRFREQATDNDRAEAAAIVDLLGGLPLALDQAGAYIEEHSCSLADYKALYQQRRRELLGWLGRFPTDYPSVVATTWEISFQQIEAASPAAAELLRLCAFLDPDAIPEELLSEGAPEFGHILSPVAADSFELNEAIQTLLRYSFIRRNRASKTLTIHRLVQVVLTDKMDWQTQYQWAERAVKAVNIAFPNVAFDTWPLCQRYLPHALICALHVHQWKLYFPQVARLLDRAAEYLQACTQFLQAEPLYQQALTIREHILGSEHPDIAHSLNNLGRLYEAIGRYAEAEPLYQRALGIRENTLGSEHPDISQSLNNLAHLYDVLGQYDLAEAFYQRALAVDEKVLGLEHPNLAIDLNNLALLYYNQKRYDLAEHLYQQALAIDEQALGSDHPDIATNLNNLALLYKAQNNFAAAESLLQRALSIKEKALGPHHPTIVPILGNYVSLLREMGKETEARKLEEKSLDIQTKDAQENLTL